MTFNLLRKRRTFIAVTGVVALLMQAPAAKAQILTYDEQTYLQAYQNVQNGLQQLTQLKSQLQAQMSMIQSLGSSSLPQVAQMLTSTQNLINQMNGTTYTGGALTSYLNTNYPTNLGTLPPPQTYQQLANTQMQIQQNATQAMQIQNQIAANQPLLTSQAQTALSNSDGAAGPTAAAQAGNQMLAVLDQDMRDIKALLMAMNQNMQSNTLAQSTSQAAATSLNAVPPTLPSSIPMTNF